MPHNTLTLGHLNALNRASAVRLAVDTGCDVLGFNESNRRRAQLAGFKGYRVHVAQPVRVGKRDVSGDCCTLVRKRLPYLGEWQQQVSQQVDAASRVAPDRWFNLVGFRLGSLPVAHLNVHPNAGPQVLRDNPRSPITREYRESMEWLDRMLRVYRDAGWALLVSGDFNLPDLDNDPPWSPWPRLAKHGLAWHTSHLDGIAWSTEDFKVRDKVTVPAREVGSDHPMLRVQLAVTA